MNPHPCLAALLSLTLASPLLAAGPDFNADGYGDLAIPVPFESYSGDTRAGIVHVLYGSDDGLVVAGSQLWSQDVPGIADSSAPNEQFGAAVAFGDFDADGYTDLAVSAPGEKIGSDAKAGVVHILYGSASGLTASGDQLFHQDSAGVLDSTAASDRFGADLVAADFNADAYADLAVTVPGEDVPGHSNSGAVHVFFGSASGISSAGDQLWHPFSPGISAPPGTSFASTIHAGYFNGDAFADLALGLPGASINGHSSAGAVMLLYGSASGISADGDAFFHQDSAGMADSAEQGDRLGYALAVGNFNADGFDDLAVAVPWESGATDVNGAAHILFGSASGITASASQFITQNSLDPSQPLEQVDWFGYAIVAGNFNNDDYADLAIGSPSEDVEESHGNVGIVQIAFGSPTGISSTGDLTLIQSPSNRRGFFGNSLAVSDVNGDGSDDLAVGAPFTDLSSSLRIVGALNIRFGSSAFGILDDPIQVLHQNIAGFPDSAEQNDLLGQNAMK